jgi:RNA 2',3'-cyclic 3'-phosphodiesterase
MRLFIALNLPAAERRRLHRASAALREAELPVKWLPPESYHLTLKFLGEVPPADIDRIQGLVGRIASKASPFPLRLGDFGAFPSVRRPRVVWCGAEALPQLRALKHDLEWELASLGFERELRAFHPHITLGRAAPDARAGDFRELEGLVAGLRYEAVVEPSTVDLMQSRLSPAGATYTAVARSRLGGARAAGAGAPAGARPPS